MPLTCPTDDKLLLFVLGYPLDDDLRNHVATCASCRSEVAELRAVIGVVDAASASAPASPGGCLDELALAALVEGRDPDSRAERVAHLAGCGHCRAQLASLVHLLSVPDVAAEVRQLGGVANGVRIDVRFVRTRLPARGWLTAGGLLAAAAAVLLVVRPGLNDRSNEGASQHRGPTIAAATAPTLRSPVGDVIGVRTLDWSAVADATRYRLTLFDVRGHSLLETETTDTSFAVPDSITFVPGQSYLWKVEARGGPGRWSSSELIEFRIRPDSVAKTSFRSSGVITGVAYALPVTSARDRDSLRLIAPRLSDSLLAGEARSRPLELREAISGTLALATRGDAAARDRELITAQRLAAAYATAWSDVFLVREVSRFAAWSPRQRAGKIRGDSARRAGITAFSQDGAAAAIVIWRRTLPVFTAIADTAGIAATLGNIGAGLARDGSPDSAERYLDRSLALAVRVGDFRVQANVLSELAGLRESQDDLAEASALYARAMAFRKRIGDTRGLASDYNNLAGLARTAGDLALAQTHLEAALEINRRDRRPEVAATNLVNLAALASVNGDFARAIAFYSDAIKTWRIAGRFADVADAQRGLGELELRRGNYSSAHAHLVNALAIYERTGPLNDALAVRGTLATTSAASGHLQAAVEELRVAQRLADSAGVAPGVRAGITLARADLATQLNLRAEAERLFASAQKLFHAAGDRSGEAEAQQGRGAILLDKDDVVGAKTLLDGALRTQTATGNLRGAALTRLLLGELSLHQGDTIAARRHLVRAEAELARLGDPVATAAALGQRASLEAAASSPAAAESLYRSAIALIGDRIAPDATWRLHAGLGAALRARGAIEEASREFRAAIAAIEGSGRSLAMPERRSAFLTDKWDPYVQLALLEEARGRLATAFDVSERLRANEMLGLLSMGQVAVPADATAELSVGEQDLRHRIAELTRALEGGAAGRTDRGPDISAGAAVTREALLREQATYAELQLEIRERAPRHATLVSRSTSSSRDVARNLARDEAFVEYLLSDERSIAFVITRDTVVSVQLSVSRHDIAQLVDFARGTLQPGVSLRNDSLWMAPLRQLHADLISPIEATGLLEKKTRLTIVPHAELHYLPFAALMNGNGRYRFLIQRYEITVTPSASVWLALGARVRGRPTTGLLAFAPRPEALPWSRREVAAIARLSGADTRVMIGTTATETAFRSEAATRRVIHLATYGVLNKQNPLFSFVEFARGTDDDGRLEAHEVFGMQLTADLVVLSACQTGLASGALTDVPPGDDWVGLVRAFLSAGAGGVMASLWPVQDQATAQLMEQFYTRYTARVAPARALADAQRAMIATPTTSHPYQWAGFAMVGSR